jgi:hypothetical protein
MANAARKWNSGHPNPRLRSIKGNLSFDSGSGSSLRERPLALGQHRVVRRYAQRQLNRRTDIVALAEAKAEIRRLVERDFNRKSTRGRKRHARFMADHSNTGISPMISPALPVTNPNDCTTQSSIAAPGLALSDEEVLPVFEADFDLPLSPVRDAVDAAEASVAERGKSRQ